MYRPLTGQPCTCKKGQERDNCARCEGGGARIDFEKIRNTNEMARIEVISIRRTEGCGNLLAFMDIRVGGALVITQCAIMTGKRGIFATLPRQLARDGHWRDVCIVADDALRAHYHEIMIREYEQEVTKANAN